MTDVTAYSDEEEQMDMMLESQIAEHLEHRDEAKRRKLVETCPECRGHGFRFQHIAPWDGPSEPCPTCNGQGHLLSLDEEEK